MHSFKTTRYILDIKYVILDAAEVSLIGKYVYLLPLCVCVCVCVCVCYTVNQCLLCLLSHKDTFIAYNVLLINNAHHNNKIYKNADLLPVI